MKNYSNQFVINASPETIMNAILKGVDKWWTTRANKTDKVGDELLAPFNKEGTLFMKMKVAKIKARSLVHWKVIDDNMSLDGSIPPKEWVGTTIKWELKVQGDKTVLNFEHDGLTPQLVCYNVCENGWDRYLNSFVEYLNTGKGSPAIIEK